MSRRTNTAIRQAQLSPSVVAGIPGMMSLSITHRFKIIPTITPTSSRAIQGFSVIRSSMKSTLVSYLVPASDVTVIVVPVIGIDGTVLRDDSSLMRDEAIKDSIVHLASSQEELFPKARVLDCIIPR